jgi:nitroreductase
MTFKETVHYRRSVRKYKSEAIDPDIVKSCLELATLAPNSSNMQCWEFYHIVDSATLKKMAHYCLDQQAATTAQQMVVFVTRQDLAGKRRKALMALETQNVLKNSPDNKKEARVKRWQLYYGKVIPFLYGRFFGLLGLFRKIFVHSIGLFRPMVRQVSEGDMRVVVHKTCALAAQTFMLAMADEGLDTCPMEGFDSVRVKRLLDLPFGAEINMVVSCGIRDEGGIWGDRMRVEFEEVYRRK